METEAGPRSDMVKWAKKGLQTNSAGVYSVNLGPNVFEQEPVPGVIPVMGTGSYDWRATFTGNKASGFTITVTFTTRKNTIDISLGALLGVGLIEAVPGVITFDMLCSERTA